jgi:hypothetical protein
MAVVAGSVRAMYTSGAAASVASPRPHTARW